VPASIVTPITPELPGSGDGGLVARTISEALDVRIGETRVPLDARNAALRTSETNAGNLVTDVMRARLQADVALMNGGGIRGNQLVPAGALTRRDINALLPFLNLLVMVEVPGKVLLEVLERSVSVYPRESGGFLQVSGLSFVFDPARPPGQRVVRVVVAASLRPRAALQAGEQPHGRGRRRVRDAGDGEALVFPEDGPGLAETLLEASSGPAWPAWPPRPNHAFRPRDV
jgi:2',3'-cyclic-nucleotide 2'-phosphodiesterase (5'-nucleotidase family)